MQPYEILIQGDWNGQVSFVDHVELLKMAEDH